MFKNMKALPKALMIGVPIALAIWGWINFGPKPSPKAPEVPPAIAETVPAESDVVKRAAAALDAPIAKAAPVAAVPDAEPAPSTSNVTSGDAGMAALLKAGAATVKK